MCWTWVCVGNSVLHDTSMYLPMLVSVHVVLKCWAKYENSQCWLLTECCRVYFVTVSSLATCTGVEVMLAAQYHLMIDL
jgi:hypothetical protein